MIAGPSAAVRTWVTHAAHGRIVVGGPHKNGLVTVRSTLYAVRRMAGGTFHAAIFVQGKYVGYFHLGRNRFVERMPGIMLQPRPRIHDAAVVTRKAHVIGCNHLFRLIVHQIRTSAFYKKSVDPAEVAYGTGLG
jgi:hypothetical protein